MNSMIASLRDKLLAAARVMLPTFGLAGVLVISRQPELGAMTDADGALNGLPFLIIGCLGFTLVMLLRWR